MLHVYLCILCMSDAKGGWERVLGPLRLELGIFFKAVLWYWGSNPHLEEQQVLNSLAIAPLFRFNYFLNCVYVCVFLWVLHEFR